MGKERIDAYAVSSSGSDRAMGAKHTRRQMIDGGEPSVARAFSLARALTAAALLTLSFAPKITLQRATRASGRATRSTTKRARAIFAFANALPRFLCPRSSAACPPAHRASLAHGRHASISRAFCEAHPPSRGAVSPAAAADGGRLLPPLFAICVAGSDRPSSPPRASRPPSHATTQRAHLQRGRLEVRELLGGLACGHREDGRRAKRAACQRRRERPPALRKGRRVDGEGGHRRRAGGPLRPRRARRPPPRGGVVPRARALGKPGGTQMRRCTSDAARYQAAENAKSHGSRLAPRRRAPFKPPRALGH